MAFDQSNALSTSTPIDKVCSTPLARRLRILLQSPLFISAIIAAVTLLVFFRTLDADFVAWDDDIVIYENLNIRGLSLEHLVRIFKDVDSMMRYNPLTLLSWSVTYYFCGLNPFWYHFGNWLLHGLNAALVFLIIRKLLILAFSKKDEAEINSWRITISAAVAALFWSLHPLRVEPVAWANARTYCQSLFFLLLSLLFYLQASEAGMNVRLRYIVIMTASVVCYVASLLSHAIGMSFFVVLIVLDVYPLGRLGGSAGWRSTTARQALWEKVPFTVAALAVALVTVSIRIASAGVWKKPVPLSEFGLIERFMQAMYIWAYYFWRPWYPVNLAPVYTTLVSFVTFSLPFISSALVIVSGITVLVLQRRRWPLGLALAICHLILLVPVLGVLEYPHYPCDRYSLISSICWSVLIAAWIANSKIRRLFRSILIVSAIMIITVLGMLSFQQTRVWQNSFSLFNYMLQTFGDDPYLADIYWRLGRVFFQQGDDEQAIKYFQQSLEIEPNFADTHHSLGLALASQGKIKEATIHFRRALQLKPDHAEAHSNLGVMLSRQGKLNEAIRYFRKSLQTEPDSFETCCNLARAFSIQGKLDEAITYYRQALELNPDSAQTHNILAKTLTRTGQLNSAIEHCRHALLLNPVYIEPLNNLARILATHPEPKMRDANKAISLAQRAAKLTKYQNPTILDTLAAAFAAAGQFEQAVTTAQAALELAGASQNNELANHIRKQLELYKQEKAQR